MNGTQNIKYLTVIIHNCFIVLFAGIKGKPEHSEGG